MRVMHVDHTHEPGGAQLALARMLAAEAWEAVLHVPPPTLPDVYGHVPCRVEHAGPRQRPGVARGTTLGGAARFATDVLRAAGALRRSRHLPAVDVVHANSSRAALYSALAVSGMSDRPRLVLHLRDAVDQAALGSPGASALRAAIRCADGVIANSQFTLDSARRFVRRDAEAAVIASPSGLGRRVAQRDARGPVKVIGMVARLDEWKGHMLLLEAFLDAFPDRPDVRLKLAGGAAFGNSHTERSILHHARHLGLSSRVDLLGHVDDVDSLLDEIDIAVQCSLRPEPMGQNVRQYLARGVPTVAANEGGPSELVRDGVNGLLFEARSRAALAAALRRLDEDRALRARLAAEGPRTPALKTDAEVVEEMRGFFARVSAKGAN